MFVLKKTPASTNPKWTGFQSEGNTCNGRTKRPLSVDDKGDESVVHEVGVYVHDKLLLPDLL